MGLGQIRIGGWYQVGTVSAEPDVEYHIRYGGYGGIGYYLVADSYIALFSRFSTCGAWEGHYILDFIEENRSDVRRQGVSKLISLSPALTEALLEIEGTIQKIHQIRD